MNESNESRGLKVAEGKWRQKSDSWNKQLNPLTVIQDDAMGITQTSKGCAMTSSIILILDL